MEKSDLKISEVKMFPELISDLLHSGHNVRFRAPGRSMYPTIREGEVITVEPVLPKDVRKGDILLYRLEESPIAHRVARIERHKDDTLHFLLRDDTWGCCEDSVAAGQVLGRVLSVERAGRMLDPNTMKFRMRLAIHRVGSRLKRFFVHPPD